MDIKINLIPPQRKEEIKKANRLRRILKWEAELLLVFIFFIILLVSINSITQINLSVAVSELDLANRNSNQYQAIGKYDAEAKEMNGTIARVGKIQDAQLYWSKMLKRFAQEVVPGIEIGKLSTKNYAIFLTGKADTRDNLIAFRDNLTGEDCFTDINLPLSNLVSKDNIDFQMDLKVKKECLR